MSKLDRWFFIRWQIKKIFKTTFSNDKGLHNSPTWMLPIFKPEEDIIKFLEVVFFKITSITSRKRNICIGTWLKALLTYYPDL